MKSKIRGFEVVVDTMKKTEAEIKLPIRGSKGSAGYDFHSTIGFMLKPKEEVMIWTDVKAYMLEDEVLKMYTRSSMGMKGLFLKNTVGIIDSTYYSNVSNDGNIGLKFVNLGDNEIVVVEGERVAQGVFLKYLQADNDLGEELAERTGGYGSTGQK
jgi:dUTP pyrophosphatase